MQAASTNQDWIVRLSTQDDQQVEAITSLRELLLRAAMFTLVTHMDDISAMQEQDRLALAEDCAQEALHAVLNHLADFRGESKFTTWAYKFGVNIALTRARKERWKAISLDALAENEESLDWFQWNDGLDTGDSENPTLQAEAAAIIKSVLDTELTPRQRQVLIWIAFDDVPMDVVVERLGTNRNAIYKLLHDARLKVKRKLAAHGYEIDEVYELFRTG